MDDFIYMLNEATFHGPVDTSLCIIASVMTVVLYLSPGPTIWRIWKKGSTEEFHPYPYLMIGFNCWMWLCYSIFPAGQPPMATPFYGACLHLINWFGVLFSVIYCGIFAIYTTNKNTTIMSCSVQLGFVLVILPALCIVWYWAKTIDDEVKFLEMIQHRLIGPICTASGIAVYASPLSIIKNIYETKSVEYLPFWLCLACFLNGVAWVIYVCASPIPDLYIAITNGVGLLLGLFQLLVYYKFHRSSHKSSRIHPEGVEVC